MKTLFLHLILVISPLFLEAQRLNWTKINDARIPEGIHFFEGVQNSGRAVRAWYVEIPANHPTHEVVPVKAKNGSASTDQISAQYDAIFTTNGGFFGGDVSVSTLITYQELIERNISALNRNGVTLPVIRSAAVWRTENLNSVEYVYHRNATETGFWRFDDPLPYSNGASSPLAVNYDQVNAGPIENYVHAIGGGPTLVKDSTLFVTYDEEVFWGSGVGKDDADPRTAIGFKSDGTTILMVVDGRQSSSFGMSLTEVARELLALGCTEAMNLDGGGSSQIAFDGEMVNRPVGSTSYRNVVTALAVVPKGSLAPDTTTATNEIIYDSAEGYYKGGWFETANDGFYGSTPSLLHTTTPASIDTAHFVYKFEDVVPGYYTIDLWWVSSSNRSNKAPIDIYHASNQKQTLEVDQVQNNAQWVRMNPIQMIPESPAGSFYLSGDGSDSLVIRANTGESGKYVVSDAVRLNFIQPTSIDEGFAALPSTFQIISTYPNPFNPNTQLQFDIATMGEVSISVYNSLGKEVMALPNKVYRAGTHYQQLSFSGLPSGIYFIRARFMNGSEISNETVKVSLLR